MKRQATNLKKIFGNHISEKGLMHKIQGAAEVMPARVWLVG